MKLIKISLFAFFCFIFYKYNFFSFFKNLFNNNNIEKKEIKNNNNFPDCLDDKEIDENEQNKSIILHYLILLYFVEVKLYIEIITAPFKNSSPFAKAEEFFIFKFQTISNHKIYTKEELEKLTIEELQKLIANFQDLNDKLIFIYKKFIERRKYYTSLLTEEILIEEFNNLENQFLIDIENLFKKI